MYVLGAYDGSILGIDDGERGDLLVGLYDTVLDEYICVTLNGILMGAVLILRYGNIL